MSDTLWSVLSDAGAFMVVAFGFSVPLFLALSAVFAQVRSRSIEVVGLRTLTFMGYVAPINLVFRLVCDIAHLEHWPGSDTLAGPLGVAVVIALDVLGWMFFMLRDERPAVGRPTDIS